MGIGRSGAPSPEMAGRSAARGPWRTAHGDGRNLVSPRTGCQELESCQRVLLSERRARHARSNGVACHRALSLVLRRETRRERGATPQLRPRGPGETCADGPERVPCGSLRAGIAVALSSGADLAGPRPIIRACHSRWGPTRRCPAAPWSERSGRRVVWAVGSRGPRQPPATDPNDVSTAALPRSRAPRPPGAPPCTTRKGSPA